MLKNKIKLLSSVFTTAVVIGLSLSVSYAATVYTTPDGAGARFQRNATSAYSAMASGGPISGSYKDTGTGGMFDQDGLSNLYTPTVRTDVHYYNDNGSSALDWETSKFVYCIHNRKRSPDGITYPDIGYDVIEANANPQGTFRTDSAIKDTVTKNGVVIILQNGFPVSNLGFANSAEGYADAYSATAMAIRFWMAERERDLNAAGVFTFLWNYNVYDTSRSSQFGTITAIAGSGSTQARNQAVLNQAHILLGLAQKAKQGGTTGIRTSKLEATSGNAVIEGDYFVYTSSVTIENLAEGYIWTHNLPAGSIITKENNGHSIKVMIPRSTNFANQTYSVRLDGFDKAHTKNVRYHPNTSNTVTQNTIGMMSSINYSAGEEYQPVDDAMFNITTPAIPPDLVASVSSAKSAYAPGETVTAVLNATNSGDSGATGFTTRWGHIESTANPSLATNVRTGASLAVGGSFSNSYNIATRATRDGYSIRFGYYVDATGVVWESREDNNIAYRTVTVNRAPDLEITSVSLSSNVIIPGKTGTLTVAVRNNGLVAPSVNSVLKAISVSTGSVSGGQTILTTIGAGDTHYYTFAWTCPTNHPKNTPVTVMFKADSDEQVAEYNEGNNHRSLTFTPVWPDLTGSITLVDGKTEYEAGETVRVSTTINNIGTHTATNFKSTLEIEILGSGSNIVPGYTNQFASGPIVRTYTTASLSPNGSIEPETFSFVAPTSLTAEQIKFTFTVDSANNVAESNEANNESTATINVHQLRPNLYFDGHNITDYYGGNTVVITARVMNGTEQPVPAADITLKFAGQELTETIAVQGKGQFRNYVGNANYEGNFVVFKVNLPSVADATAYEVEMDIIPVPTEVELDDNALGYYETDGTFRRFSSTITPIVRFDMPSPDDSLMESDHQKRNKLLPSLPIPAINNTHTWYETRFVGGEFVPREFTAILQTVFTVSPDSRVAIKDYPNKVESGFGITATAQTQMVTNYDRPEKLVGAQMIWSLYPETEYGQEGDWELYNDSLETSSGTAGSIGLVNWQLPVSPHTFFVDGQRDENVRLHYTPVWTPDGNYDVMGQAFYAWSPLGQMFEQVVDNVEIEGNMYERFPIFNR
jgi:hypothetical protein